MCTLDLHKIQAMVGYALKAKRVRANYITTEPMEVGLYFNVDFGDGFEYRLHPQGSRHFDPSLGMDCKHFDLLCKDLKNLRDISILTGQNKHSFPD
jgi:hypothetical protein